MERKRKLEPVEQSEPTGQAPTDALGCSGGRDGEQASLDALASLVTAPQRIAEMPHEELHAILRELACKQVQFAALLASILAACWQASSGGQDHRVDDDGDRLITPEQAAEILGVDVRWLRRRYHDLPFVRFLDARTVRVSLSSLRRWMERKKQKV